MKIFTLITSILLGFLMFGCIERQECCDLPDSHIFYVNLQKADGNSLLNNQSGEAIDLSKTRLYLNKNGNFKMFQFESNGILDDPYGVAPVIINDKSAAKISFIYEGDEKEIKGFIQWNEVLVDTLDFTFNSTDYSTYLTKISQSGTTLWDVEADPNSEILVKLEH